jgi:hypothetical protein
MADITMCSGLNCPIAEKCYRYTAPKGMYQSMFMEVPYDHKTTNCKYFLKDDRRRDNNTDDK